MDPTLRRVEKSHPLKPHGCPSKFITREMRSLIRKDLSGTEGTDSLPLRRAKNEKGAKGQFSAPCHPIAETPQPPR